MTPERELRWLIPVCVAVAVVVLFIDLHIKNAIVDESLKLREVISGARTAARTDRDQRDNGHDRSGAGMDGTGPVETSGGNLRIVPPDNDAG